MNVCFDEEKMLKRFDELEQKTAGIECKDDYDLLKKSVIERFTAYGREDVCNAQYDRAVYTYQCIEEIFQQLTKKHKCFAPVPNYTTHRPRIDGFSMKNKEGRPVFYVGYNYFGKVSKDISEFQKIAANTIQIEIGPANLMFPRGTHRDWGVGDDECFQSGESFCYEDGEFDIYLSAVLKDVIPILKQAEKDNVSVTLLISPHYFPRWMLEKHSELCSKAVGFFGYRIYHPKAIELLKIYLRALIPMVEGFSSLGSICLSNEPAFDISADTAKNAELTHDLLPTEYLERMDDNTVMKKWQDFLKERFQTVAQLNASLNTDFSDFDEIDMPRNEDSSPLFYEWYLWNNRMLADWHKLLADEIHSMAPNIPICAKIMPVFGTSEMPFHRRFLRYGVDPEEFADFSDLSGNDAWSFYRKSHLPLTYKLAWYDYLASIKTMPIQNSEDHFIEDRDGNYEAIQAKRIYADVWQGAVHGRTVSQVWVWGRSDNPRSSTYGSVLHRPDCIEAIGRATLDLNRLAYEVTAFQHTKPKVAILYSKESRIYDMEYIADMFKAYEAVLFAGHKVHFLHEDRMDELNQYSLLILPNVVACPDSVKEHIAEYQKQGGQVLIIERDSSSLLYDQYHKISSCQMAEQIRNKSVVLQADSGKVSPNSEFSASLAKEIIKIIPQPVELICDHKENLEWFCNEYNGSTYINLCNHNLTEVVIYVKGHECFDCILQKELEEKFVVQPYQCMLIRLV